MLGIVCWGSISSWLVVGRDECYVCVCVCVCVSWASRAQECEFMKVLLRVLGHSLLPYLHPASPTVLPTRTSSLQTLHLGLERSISRSNPPAGGISPGTRLSSGPFYRPASSQAPGVVSTHFLLRDGLCTARWEGLGKRQSAEWVMIFRTGYRKKGPWTHGNLECQ